MRRIIAVVAGMAAALLLAPTAIAVDDVGTKKLRKGLTTGGILEHMRSLQRIANANDGNRAAANPGYDASLAYAEKRFKKAGLKVTRDEFTFADWEQLGPATLQREGQPAYAEGTPEAPGDYLVAEFSGPGNVTAPVVTTNDIVIAPEGDPGSGTSGCEEADWAGQDLAGKVALVERGTCTFVEKIELAKRLGAAAVLIFNDGYADRTDAFQPPAPPFIGIPVAGMSYAAGSALYNAVRAGAVNVTFNVQTSTEEVPQYNLIADTKKGDPERTIVIGAHLDSVDEGAGINDNGSGSGTVIEIAEQVAKLKKQPRNRIRFALWGAEEAGLVGSTAYVADLIESGEIDDIEANLNFDMLASPNFVRFVYDGDNSTGEGAEGPPGSAQIEQVFLRYFASKGLAVEPTAFDGRSDYGPFIAADALVPAGGLFSGAEGVKTEEQAAVYGGSAGSWYDPCYHQACDSLQTVLGTPPFPDATGLETAEDAAALDGNGVTGLDQLSDAAAHATWTLARSKSSLLAPAVAKRAGTAKAVKRAKRAAKRASRTRAWKGGLGVR
ncbi:MAG: M28 family peptidase [Thermoleophilaceae bacterium]|nr:M28 family peptidase [Thermoleophilaceae bacterium]